MSRNLLFTSILFLSVNGIFGQTHTLGTRLIGDIEYTAMLQTVDKLLPKWETAFMSLDLEKVPQLSYAQGKAMADTQKLGLMEVGYSRNYVARQRLKRTVSGELALVGFLESLLSEGLEMISEESFSGLTLTTLDKYVPELSELAIRMHNDATARVELLEKSCAL